MVCTAHFITHLNASQAKECRLFTRAGHVLGLFFLSLAYSSSLIIMHVCALFSVIRFVNLYFTNASRNPMTIQLKTFYKCYGSTSVSDRRYRPKKTFVISNMYFQQLA